jgi:hypothetical protein
MGWVGSDFRPLELNERTKTMDWNRNLTKLRSAMTDECALRMNRDHRLSPDEVAAWLIRDKRELTISGLADLVCQQMEHRSDDDRVRRVLQHRPELQEHEPGLRQISETLGVPLWWLLSLPVEETRPAYEAACLIYKLRADADQATLEAMQRFAELLGPAWDGHPERTAGEAFRIIEQETDKTIRDLEE